MTQSREASILKALVKVEAFFFLIYSSIERTTERGDTQRSSIHWVVNQMATVAMIGLGLGQQPGTSSTSPMWVQRPKHCPPRPSTGSCIESGAGRTYRPAPIWDASITVVVVTACTSLEADRRESVVRVEVADWFVIPLLARGTGALLFQLLEDPASPVLCLKACQK